MCRGLRRGDQKVGVEIHFGNHSGIGPATGIRPSLGAMDTTEAGGSAQEAVRARIEGLRVAGQARAVQLSQ